MVWRSRFFWSRPEAEFHRYVFSILTGVCAFLFFAFFSVCDTPVLSNIPPKCLSTGTCVRLT